MGIEVKAGRLTASYATARYIKPATNRWVDLTNSVQLDGHSCGFVAALTVIRYYHQDTFTAQDVLKVVRPSINWGTNRYQLMSALEVCGVRAEYRENLTISRLQDLVVGGIPVIVSVWPDVELSDHWTIVHGFFGERIYLTNYGVMAIDEFMQDWSDMDMRNGRGDSMEGIVCYKRGLDISGNGGDSLKKALGMAVG